MAQRSFRTLVRWSAPLLALIIAATLFPVSAQTDVRTFPETGHTLRGLFRSFWEINNGLANFGLPLTEEYVAANGRTSQWFERARFELTEQGGRAVVELGRLGVEVTGGKIFPKVPPIENTADRRYIAETQHIIQYGFKEIWETRGDTRIFGYPISEEIDEILEDGEWHTVQYFERARFEYWPNFPPGQRVLLSRLGSALVPRELTPPPGQAGPAPAPAPGGPAPAVPASVNASVTPQSGPPGTSFAFTAQGFNAGERVGIWLTAPDQSTFGADFQATADGEGSIAADRIGITTDASFPDGIWSFNAQGVESGKQAIGYFRISRSGGSAGDPNKLGQVAHDGLTIKGNVAIFPVAAPSGRPFILFAGGYSPGEEISAWFTGPDGKSTSIDGAFVLLDDEGVVEVEVQTGGLPNGVYTAVARGNSSGVESAAGFRLTSDYIAGPGTPRPASVNGSATPADATVGTVIQVRGQGLAANEEVEYWVTDPSGAYTLVSGTPRTDEQGRIGYAPSYSLQVTDEALSGIYGLHFRGRSSGKRVDIYFTVTGTGGRGSLDFRQGWAK
jgi:hypothetical protein